MAKLSFAHLVLIAALLAGCSAEQSGRPLPAPPVTLRTDSFYAQYRDAGGLPVLGSARVPPEAIRRAAQLVRAMTAHRPELRAALVARGYRIAIMAESEGKIGRAHV